MARQSSQYPPEVCARLDALANARTTEKSMEQDLVRQRKQIREELARISWGSTGKHKDLALEYTSTLFQLEYSRARQRELADKIESTIANAHQGELFDDLDAIVKRKGLEEIVAGHAGDGDDEEDDGVDRPADVAGQIGLDGKPAPAQAKGRGGKRVKAPIDPNAPVGVVPPPAIDGVDQHLQASVQELDINDGAKGKLIAGGLPTVGHVAKVLDGPDGRARLADLINAGETIVSSIARAVKSYRANHRQAMREAEGQ